MISATERVGIVEYQGDPSSGQASIVGPAIERLLVYPLANWATPGFFDSIVHSADRDQVIHQQRAHLATRGTVLAQRYRLLASDGQITWVEDRRISPDAPGQAIRGLWIDIGQGDGAARIADQVSAMIDGQVGDAFFAKLVLALAERLGVKAAAVGAINPRSATVTTVALCIDGALAPAITYPLSKSPCAEVAAGATLIIADRVLDRYPSCPVLERTNATGYVGVPVYDSRHEPIGMLVVLEGRPIPPSAQFDRMLASVAARTGAELERRLFEADRVSLQSQLEKTHKMEALGTLAGGIAHDFNNILMGILGNTEMALEEVEPWHPANANLVEIRRASQRARDLVQQILAFGRKQDPVRRPVAMKTVIDDLVVLLRASLPSTIELVVEHPSAPCVVMADVGQIHQTILSLTANASYAIGHRPGQIAIRSSLLDLEPGGLAASTQLPAGPYFKVSVSDTGTGMDHATIARAFEPFFTTKPPGLGTGLGLAVAHGIMQEHEGAIVISGEPNVGALVELFFPVCNPAELAETVDEGGPLPAGAGQHLLIVDDEDAVVRVTTRMLERLGYRVTAFGSPRLAIAAIEEAPDVFDLVISDLTMPEITGLDLAERIRQLRPTIPIVLCSGHAHITPDDRLPLIDGLLQKPFESGDLARLVHRLVGRAEAPPGTT